VFLGPLIPQHPQDLAISFIVGNMLQEPINSFSGCKIRNLTLQANKSRECTLRAMFFEIVIRTKDDASEYSIDTLEASEGVRFLIK
jgi:hypothetical protein